VAKSRRLTLDNFQLHVRHRFGRECRAPEIANTDFNLQNFKIKERVTLQFRMEFFNLFNKVQFRGTRPTSPVLIAILLTPGLPAMRAISVTLGANASVTPSTRLLNLTPTVTRHSARRKPTLGRAIQYALKITF
jgi:hypothetical protein